MTNYYVGIMAGGIGSRFWPVSRNHLPKQFLDFLGTGKSLLQMTFDRFNQFIPTENIYIITAQQYIALTKEHLPQLSEHQILAEPVRRNTAPCIAYFANKIHHLNPNAVMAVAPADHLILNEDKFMHCIQKGLAFAETHNNLLTLGIKPSRPDTGYGYIQYRKKDAAAENIFKVKTFTEKPPLELAKTFLESGDFLWNSGIFLWSTKSILAAFDQHLFEVSDIFKTTAGIYNTPKEQTFIDAAYGLCTNVSIDYGVMEKADNVLVIPGDFNWSDLGTWGSLYENMKKDYLGNAVSGKNVMVYDAVNCMVSCKDEKLAILMGLQDFCVIDTDDVLLIFKKDQQQEIKKIVADVKRKKGDEFM